MKLWCALIVLSAVVAAASATKCSKECMWSDYIRHDNVSAWEFQAQPHRHMIRDRDKAIGRIEQILQSLTNDPKSGVQFIPNSRWMAIFKETSFMLTTRHGHPLHRDPDDKHAQPFPWKGVGYLRLRNYQILTPAGAYVPAAMPGMADLTFKMKKVDPDVGPGDLQLPHRVGEAKITAKVENDMHCDHGRATMSPLFRPVSQTLNISKIANVKEYFPNLAQVTLLDENEALPFMHEVYRAKIVWTVVYEGVVGEANLVIKYNTTFQDAVAGASPKNGELSLRIRREVAEATGTTGEKGKQKLYKALDVIGDAMQAFRDAGWDGKTPSLPSKKSQGVGEPGNACGKICWSRYHCPCNQESAAHSGADVLSWLQGWWKAAAVWLHPTPRDSLPSATRSSMMPSKQSIRQQLLLAGPCNIQQRHEAQWTIGKAEQQGGRVASAAGSAGRPKLDDLDVAENSFMPNSASTEQLVGEEVDYAGMQVLYSDSFDGYDADVGIEDYESPLYDAEADDWEASVVIKQQ